MKKKLLKTAFPDELSKVVSFHKSFHRRRVDAANDWSQALIQGYTGDESVPGVSGPKRIVLASLLLLSLFGLFLRIFHLQVIHGFENRELADSNRIQIRIIHAPRGVIYDRNDKILAQNEPGFRLVEATGSARFITRDQALKMEIDNDSNLKNLEIDSLRSYPMGVKTAHILGYVGEISKEELDSPENKGYRPGDKVGRGGIEAVYEKFLKGIDGGEVIEVDSTGKKIRTLRETPPIPGSNLILSIDGDLQSVVFDQLKKGIDATHTALGNFANACCGAAVAMEPGTGQVLALVSYPSFDPLDLAPALVDLSAPLLNRAIAGTYPPGSTFKMISSFAGLSSGKINPSMEFEDTGVIALGPYTFANWYFSEYGRKEGLVNLIKAIQRSNDTYFYHLGEIVGEQALADMSRKFNLGKQLGIDLPGEAPGVIGTEEWKKKLFKEPWYPGDTLHTAIGQGFTLVTPLQIAAMTSTIAEDGKHFLPHLVSKITSPDGSIIKEFSYDPYIVPNLKPDDIKIVKQGMELVPKFGGTAWPFFTFNLPTAGKTGTAEFGDPKNRTHAWYTSYAPTNQPTITLTVLVEAGGEGSTVAGAISKEIYRWYFSPDKTHLSSFDQAPVATQSARILGE